ncbi:MAG: DUF4184 family protein [Bacteroidetes bacterium]|nr:DUF4184 family protein [Bacteroidota bacterium]
MPFTFAHPSVVFPLFKKVSKYFSATGLIAGSIIPDFEYFARLYSLSVITHTKKDCCWLMFQLRLHFALHFIGLLNQRLFQIFPQKFASTLFICCI